MQCTKTILKTLLAIVSVLFFVAGCVLMGVGIWMVADKIFITHIIGSQLFAASSYLLIICGCVLVVVSFVGCAGLFQENACIIISYFACLIFLFVMMLIAAILAVVFKGDLETHMMNSMKETITENYGYQILRNEDNNIITKAWDDTQKRFKCCGVEDKRWSVYKLSHWYREQHGMSFEKKFVPSSCCVYDETTYNYLNLKNCQSWQYGPPKDDDGANNDALFSKGCYTTAREFVIEQSVILVIVGFVFSVLVVLGMVLCILLYRHLTYRPKIRRQTKSDKPEIDI